MRRIFFCVIYIYGFSGMYAQVSEEYNSKGDQAQRNGDYQLARSQYSYGLPDCHLYSIQQLVKIWKEQISMQESMRFPMRRCFNCLITKSEEGIKEAMLLLSEFYYEGIGGIEIDSVKGDRWLEQYKISGGSVINETPDLTDSPVDPTPDKIPKRSLLSNRFSSFVAYTASPTMPFGLTAGIYFDKIGGYASYRNNFKATTYAYECNNTKVPDIDIENPPYEFNRESWNSQMIIGGVLYPVIKNQLFVSVGGGYGIRDYYREIRTVGNQTFQTGNNREWCYNTEASYRGLTLEAGGMFVWKKLMMLGGVNSTRFKDLDVYFGLGLTF